MLLKAFFLCGVTAIGMSQAQHAYAVKVSALGFVGYENIRFSKDLDMKGFGLGAGAQFVPLEISAGTDLLLSANLKYYSASVNVRKTDFNMSQFIFTPKIGLQVKVNPKFTVSTSLGYDWGLTGKYSSKFEGTEVSNDTKSYSSITHEWNGLFNVTPQVGVGLGMAWQAGTVEIPVPTFPINTSNTVDADFRGFAVRVLVGFQF